MNTPSQPSDLTEIFGEPIYAYTRRQAIEDGVLVDLMQDTLVEVCRQHYKYPIACTIAVFAIMQRAVENERHANSYAGILHDMLWMSRVMKRDLDESTKLFQVKIVGAERRSLFEFKMICGPGDTAEPVITILLPHEIDMNTSKCTTVREWQETVSWPPDAGDLQKLDELIHARLHEAMAKCDELQLPDFCKAWVNSYRGLNDRGCHLWDSAIRTGGYDIDVFDGLARREASVAGWRYMEQWSNGYRTVLISPKHHLTLTYCEGDITLVYCPSRQHFSAELRHAAEFYKKYS